MEKSFVGFGPASTPLPVREQDGAALARRGQIGAVLRQLYGLLAGLAGGWAMLYGQLSPFALGLVLGLGEDCFAACGAGAVLALLLRGQGVRTVCLICAVGGAVVARWLWPRRYLPAAAAGCVLLLGSAFCFRMYIGGDGLLFSGAEAVLARVRAETVVTCGLSQRDSLTLSSLSEPVVCLQRALLRPDGGTVEPQEFPLPPDLPAPAEALLPLFGLRLLQMPLTEPPFSW